MSKEIQVGLIGLTDIEDYGRAALLQRISSFDYDTSSFRPYAGAYRFTCQGGLPIGQKPEEELPRLLHDGLGMSFAYDAHVDFALMRYAGVAVVGSTEILTYAYYFPDPILFRSALHRAGKGDWEPARRSDIRVVDESERASGVSVKDDKRFVLLSESAMETVHRAYEAFKNISVKS